MYALNTVFFQHPIFSRFDICTYSMYAFTSRFIHISYSMYWLIRLISFRLPGNRRVFSMDYKLGCNLSFLWIELIIEFECWDCGHRDWGCSPCKNHLTLARVKHSLSFHLLILSFLLLCACTPSTNLISPPKNHHVSYCRRQYLYPKTVLHQSIDSRLSCCLVG